MTHFLSADTVDDLMHLIYEAVLGEGRDISPSKGDAKELFAVLLELRDPRARVSRSQIREITFSALGELLWYLSGNDEVAQITHYVKYYEDPQLSKNGHVIGAYGPRLVNYDRVNQLEKAITLLQEKPDSRNAVIQLFDHQDADNAPCTLTFQFVIRNSKLQMMTSMRSNDVYLGLPHDIFAFTMLQEIIARSIGVNIGSYYHSVGSLHLYTDHFDAANRYLDEGWHIDNSMPSMPIGDPWDCINHLIELEATIRTSSSLDLDSVALPSSPYWHDIALLLCAHKTLKEQRLEATIMVADRIESDYFRSLVDERMQRQESKRSK